MKRLLIIAVSTLLVFPAGAQSLQEIYRISEQNSSFSTARSSAMGGAFGSLGADAASVNANPAGLGMYRSSEVSITPSVQVASVISSSVGGEAIDVKKRHATVNLNNLSVIFNKYDKSMSSSKFGVRGFTFGITYNQLANYRTRQRAESSSSGMSIADMFGAQLFGIDPKNLYDANVPQRAFQTYPVSQWGAIEAYQTGLVFDVTDNPYQYSPSYTDADTGLPVGSLVHGDRVYPELYRRMSGNMGEYSFAGGINLRDKIYIGMTLGIQSFQFDQYDYYVETAAATNVGDLVQLRYMQWLTMSGASFSFKFGVAAEPVKGLRIGAAVHAPTIHNISEEYSSGMDNYYLNNQNYSSYSVYAPNDYKVRTAPRFIGGVSYTFGTRGVISFDYECIWYNAMRVRGLNYLPGQPTINDEIRTVYRPTNNYRVGAEAVIIPGVYLRGGYSFYANANKTQDDKYGNVQNITGGIGFRNRFFFLDLAYVHTHSEQAPFRYFSYNDPYFGDTLQSDSEIATKLNNSNIILTLGIKF